LPTHRASLRRSIYTRAAESIEYYFALPAMDPVNINAPPAFRQSSAFPRAKLNVVLQRSQCTGSLHVLDYNPLDSSETILRKLRLYFHQHMSTPWTRFWSYSLPCRKVAVGTATLDTPGLGHTVTLPTIHTSGPSRSMYETDTCADWSAVSNLGQRTQLQAQQASHRGLPEPQNPPTQSANCSASAFGKYCDTLSCP